MVKVVKQVEKSGGKYLKIELEVVSGIIRDLKVSGDFFAYPPYLLDNLERGAKGMRADPSEVDKLLSRYIGRLELVGISIEDLRGLIVNSLREAK
ncbi:MAG: hypothetical protein B6U69_02750 [Thermofilum sp. ex4484_15]|nr:MAG: hypothetical protein B6U69_02750 [Thermofilum sp. ex4484_15]